MCTSQPPLWLHFIWDHLTSFGQWTILGSNVYSFCLKEVETKWASSICLFCNCKDPGKHVPEDTVQDEVEQDHRILHQ